MFVFMARDSRSQRVLENIGNSGLGKDLQPVLPRPQSTDLLEPKDAGEYRREINFAPLREYFRTGRYPG